MTALSRNNMPGVRDEIYDANGDRIKDKIKIYQDPFRGNGIHYN